MQDTELYRRLCAFADPSTWPAALTEAVDSQRYMFRMHGGDWVVLMSVVKGELAMVQGRHTVQARIAINLITGELAHPTPSLPIGQWEAEITGRGEEYLLAEERHLNRPFSLEGWDCLGTEYGIYKGEEQGRVEA